MQSKMRENKKKNNNKHEGFNRDLAMFGSVPNKN